MYDYTLTGQELVELKRCHAELKKRKDADRVKAVYLLGSGWSFSDICEALLLSNDTIRRYFFYYKKHGLDALLKNKHLGRAGYLTEKEKSFLSSHLEETTYATVSKIIIFAKKEFNADYSESGMREILKELGFVYKKPEKVPYKVNRALQEQFISRYKKLKKKLNEGDGVYFMDATHPEHNPIPACGWIKRGMVKTVKSNPRPYRLNINGAININTLDMVVRFEKKINKETIKDFLEALRKHQPKGWIHLICDNAGYNNSPEVKALAEAMAIKLIYLPAYSPNLNLIERIWKFFKKKVLYNKHYANFSDMEKASQKFFNSIGRYEMELRNLMTEKFQKLPA